MCRHFPDKELLIEALLADHLAAIAERGEQALEQEDPWEALLRFLDYTLGLQAADRGLKELLLGTAHGRDRIARADVARPRVHTSAAPLLAGVRGFRVGKGAAGGTGPSLGGPQSTASRRARPLTRLYRRYSLDQMLNSAACNMWDPIGVRSKLPPMLWEIWLMNAVRPHTFRTRMARRPLCAVQLKRSPR